MGCSRPIHTITTQRKGEIAKDIDDVDTIDWVDEIENEESKNGIEVKEEETNHD